MSITILGAGNMAKGLAGLFANSGYEVVLGSRDPSKAQAAFASLGAKVRATDIKTAVAASELVVLAVPFNAVAATIEAAGGLAGKIVVDITNPLTADYQGLTIGHTTSAAEEIQKLAPQAKVVKAFNTLFAQVLQNGGKVGGVANKHCKSRIGRVGVSAHIPCDAAHGLSRSRHPGPVVCPISCPG